MGELVISESTAVYYENGHVYEAQRRVYDGKFMRGEPIGHYREGRILLHTIWGEYAARYSDGEIFVPGERTQLLGFPLDGVERQVGSYREGRIYPYEVDIDGKVVRSEKMTGEVVGLYDVEEGAAAAAFLAGLLPVPIDQIAAKKALRRLPVPIEEASPPPPVAQERGDLTDPVVALVFFLRLAWFLTPYILAGSLILLAGYAIYTYPVVTALVFGAGVGALGYLWARSPWWSGAGALLGAALGTGLGTLLIHSAGFSAGLGVLRLILTLIAALLGTLGALVLSRSVPMPAPRFAALMATGVLLMAGGSVYGVQAFRPDAAQVQGSTAPTADPAAEVFSSPGDNVGVTEVVALPAQASPLTLTRPDTDPVSGGLPRLYDLATTLDGGDGKACALIDAARKVKHCRVSVSAQGRYAWGSAWCAGSSAALQAFRRSAHLSYVVDGQERPASAFWEGLTSTCLKRRVIVEGVQPGQAHELKLITDLAEPVRDGQLFAAGHYELNLSVEAR